MSWCGDKVPDAVLAAGVVIGVVGAGDLAEGVGDFVFAAAFFAVALVLVEGEAVVAGADEGADGVDAFVLAAAVVYCAFVHV